jgi:hypothetical protein
VGFSIYLCTNQNKNTMSSKNFNNSLDHLESEVANHFSELLATQDEIIIFNEVDLEHDTPDDYLECRNDITGNVFDVHPLKVNKNGILVVEADGSFTRHLLKLSDLSSIQDRINLCELLENNLT